MRAIGSSEGAPLDTTSAGLVGARSFRCRRHGSSHDTRWCATNEGELANHVLDVLLRCRPLLPGQRAEIAKHLRTTRRTPTGTTARLENLERRG